MLVFKIKHFACNILHTSGPFICSFDSTATDKNNNLMLGISKKICLMFLHHIYLQKKKTVHVNSLGQQSTVLQEEGTLLNSVPYLRSIVEPATVCKISNKMLMYIKLL